MDFDLQDIGLLEGWAQAWDGLLSPLRTGNCAVDRRWNRLDLGASRGFHRIRGHVVQLKPLPGQEPSMNTCRLNLWGFDAELAPGVNRTLRVFSGAWELEDSFQLVILNGNCFYGHQVGIDVSSMIFCPPGQNPRSRDDVTFALFQFSMLPSQPAVRMGQGRFFNRPPRLRLAGNAFRWEIVHST